MLNISVLKYIFFPLFIFALEFKLQDAKKYYVEIERALLHSVNPVYFEHWDMLTRRANRNAPYTLTLNFTIIRPIGNNITVHMKVYEKVNADYKLTPLEIHFRVCEWINKDKLVIPIIRRYDLHDSFGSCPLKGNVHLKDLLIRSEDAPTGFWPFVRNKLDLKYYVTATKESIVDFSLYFRVNEVPEKKKG